MANIVAMHDAPHLTLRTVEGWTLGSLADNEPRIRDLDLGERLGYERPRAVRDLIRRLTDAGKLNDSDLCRTVRRWTPEGAVAPVEAEEFWLGEDAALLVTSQAETAEAWRLTREIVRVFRLAIRGMLPAPPPALPPGAADEGARMHDAAAAALRAGDVDAARRYMGAAYMLTRAPRQPRQRRAPRVRAEPAAKEVDLAPYIDKILRVLARGPVRSNRDLRDAVGGRIERVNAALALLVAAGKVERTTPGTSHAITYKLATPAGEVH